MTDQTAGSPVEPLMLGPLTADEWASLFLPGDDDRNPLPPCCGNISEVRDALADVMRMGGDPELGWLRIAPVWDYVAGCFDREDVLGNPVLSKIYRAYVEDREVPERDGEAYEQFRALTFKYVTQLLDTVDAPNTLFDLETAAGRQRALVRMAGVFLAFLVDDDQRQEAAIRLAEKVRMDPDYVCAVVDVMRQDRGLPYRPTRKLERHVADEKHEPVRPV
jgi:hypothetical protein